MAKPTTMAEAMTETELLGVVIDLAHLTGWLVHHCRPARTAHGWSTPIQGDAGFCDLVLARKERLLMVELKSEKGKLTPGQMDWLAQLAQSVEVFVWKPSDWHSGAIERELNALRGPSR